MIKIKFIFFISLLTAICIGCSDSSKYIKVDLDKLEKVSLKYIELPQAVQFSYKEYSLLRPELDTLINLQKGIKISMHNTTFDKSYIELFRKGFIHNFIINDLYLLELKAKKGDPFIFYNGSFFYSEELNLAEYNYRQSKYVRINLRKNKELNKLFENTKN
jgi:hypothetical protein